ncbi:hypothetical protein [Chitinophaga sp.]|nr:hypothetical protein [Chitinophaga sp.]
MPFTIHTTHSPDGTVIRFKVARYQHIAIPVSLIAGRPISIAG